MIDVENMIVDAVRNAVKTKYPNAYITSDYVDAPSNFPCVSVIEYDNSIYQRTQDNDLHEHHASVMYEINVYSNKINGKKEEAKKIMDIVDETLQSIKLTRTLKQPIPNKDKSIYRIVARYEAVIGEGKTIGKNTVYQVYRR